jgi:hypothetical protein
LREHRIAGEGERTEDAEGLAASQAAASKEGRIFGLAGGLHPFRMTDRPGDPKHKTGAPATNRFVGIQAHVHWVEEGQV